MNNKASKRGDFLLSVEEVSMSFGGLKALDRVSFRLEGGGLVGLIGPNGSGKTTCFHIITGFVKATAGHVFLGEEDVTGLPPHEIAGKRVRRTFQLTTVFRGTTVLDNILFALHQDMEEKGAWKYLSPILRLPRFRQKEEWARAEAAKVLDFVNLKGKGQQLTGNLTDVDLRLLQLAIALVSKPRVLLLDEVAAGMEFEETTSIADRIRDMSKMGIGIIAVEHNMKFIMNLCERVIVLASGNKIAEGTPREVLNSTKVKVAYLGHE